MHKMDTFTIKPDLVTEDELSELVALGDDLSDIDSGSELDQFIGWLVESLRSGHDVIAKRE